MQTPLSHILERKGPVIHDIAPKSTVSTAVFRMNAEKIGALMVCEDNHIIGIFTERDILTKIIDQKLDPTQILVEEVMTPAPITIDSHATLFDAMTIMRQHRCRHLPVICEEEDRLCGLLSIGDLTAWLIQDQEHEIAHLVNYIAGSY